MLIFFLKPYQDEHLQVGQTVPIQLAFNNLIDALLGCERILKTPVPLAYTIHLKQLLLIFCFLLPFQLVGQMGWWTGPTVALISFTLLGVEAIGMEIENPFGYDANDLPLDTICAQIKRDIESIMK